jgi:hypothetical protein
VCQLDTAHTCRHDDVAQQQVYRFATADYFQRLRASTRDESVVSQR